MAEFFIGLIVFVLVVALAIPAMLLFGAALGGFGFFMNGLFFIFAAVMAVISFIFMGIVSLLSLILLPFTTIVHTERTTKKSDNNTKTFDV
ncbi:MAG: hypothetical protein LBQ51_10970 [Desulfovibrio sp.]|nr:hypothetical protein [Desulfovibrio sp.]